MKKLLTIAAIAVLGFTANAQEVTFGAKAGVNFADITGDDADITKTRTAFHFGGVVEIEVSEKFSIQPELLYSLQGTSGDFEGENVDVKYGYLNLPVMAKFYVADRFSLEAGPQIGILLSSEAETGAVEVDLTDLTSGFDFGLNFGLGYKLENGLNFAARYNFGLSNVNHGEADDLNNQNSVIQVSVGYFF